MTWTHPTAEFESSGSQLKDPDDPWVQRRLRERRIDRAARDVEQAAIELRRSKACPESVETYRWAVARLDAALAESMMEVER